MSIERDAHAADSTGRAENLDILPWGVNRRSRSPWKPLIDLKMDVILYEKIPTRKSWERLQLLGTSTPAEPDGTNPANIKPAGHMLAYGQERLFNASRDDGRLSGIFLEWIVIHKGKLQQQQG